MDKNKDIVRIIGRLDIKGENVVKTVRSEGLRVVGNPEKLATRYYNEGIDEIIYIDIVASLYERSFDFEQLKQATKNVFVPVTAGGGIRTLDDIQHALHCGADKVAINTHAMFHPDFLKAAAEVFGSQCIVLSVEAKKIGEGKYEAYINGGREKTDRDLVSWIKEALKMGIGEILVSSVDRDGTMQGYDIDLMKIVQDISSVPVIAHGGAGKSADMADILKEVDISGVSVSSIIHYELETVKGIKQTLAKSGIKVRNI